jgi:Pyruvate/2-oxoacid:ferredoxin oxidoreductase delta subunit
VAIARLRPDRFAKPVRSPYEVNYDYCKGCGVCVEECPRFAISIQEEIRWKK